MNYKGPLLERWWEKVEVTNDMADMVKAGRWDANGTRLIALRPRDAQGRFVAFVRANG